MASELSGAGQAISFPNSETLKGEGSIKMAHAEKCPVCNGTGTVVVLPDPRGTSAVPTYQVCHGCGGRGWVVIPTEKWM